MPTNDDVYTILGMTMNMYGVEELMIGRKNIVSMHLILTAYCLLFDSHAFLRKRWALPSAHLN